MGLEIWVWAVDFVFGVQNFGVWDLELENWGLEFGVWDFKFQYFGLGFYLEFGILEIGTLCLKFWVW